MTHIYTNNQTKESSPLAAFATERREIFTIAKRMFNEGFTKNTILRICAITEEEFISMIRDLQQARKASVA